MKVIINFKETSPYYINGEKQRVVEDLEEVHYSYPTVIEKKSTAFESRNTGFTILNEHIKDFEITI